MRWVRRRPLCGSVIASRAPDLIQRLTVESSTRKRRATSRTVNSSSLFSSSMIIFPLLKMFSRTANSNKNSVYEQQSL